MEKHIYYLSNTVIPNTKREKNKHVFNVFTQVGVKQLTDFLGTVTAASDLVDCTLVNCAWGYTRFYSFLLLLFCCFFLFFFAYQHYSVSSKI